MTMLSRGGVFQLPVTGWDQMQRQDLPPLAPKRGWGGAKLAAGAVVLTTGALCVGLLTGAGPAYADATSSDYAIGSTSGPVSSVVASPTKASQSEPTNFEVTFVAVNALSGPNGAWVSVTPSVELASAPTNVGLTSGSCIQGGVAGTGGAGVATGTELTIELRSSCNISAGKKVEVDFTANAPSTTGTFDLTVTTSANATPATSNTVTVGPSGPTLSAAALGYGANTTYTVSNVTVASLSADETTLVLKAVATSGSGAIAFYNGAAGYSVSYTSSGGTSTADTVLGASAGGATATLTLGSPLANGDTLDITAKGTNPPAGAGTEANDVNVEPGNGTPEVTNPVMFGNSVTDVTVSPSVLVAGAPATYSIGFRAPDAVGTGGDIFLSETAGPTGFGSVTGIEVLDTTQRWHFVATGAVLAGGSAKIPVLDAIKAGDSLSITVANVTNPPAGTVSDFAVSTTADTVAATAAPYTIGTNASRGVLVTVNPSTTGSLATYTVSDLRASGAMAGGTSTLTVEGPAGTVFPNSAGYYSIVDSTTTSGSGTVGAALRGGGTNDVTFTVPNSIRSGDQLALTVQDVINPTSASSTYSVTVVGNVTGPPPVAPTTTTTARPTTTTRPAPRKSKPVVTALTTKAAVVRTTVGLKLRCSGAICHGTMTLNDGRALPRTGPMAWWLARPPIGPSTWTPKPCGSWPARSTTPSWPRRRSQ